MISVRVRAWLDFAGGGSVETRSFLGWFVLRVVGAVAVFAFICEAADNSVPAAIKAGRPIWIDQESICIRDIVAISYTRLSPNGANSRLLDDAGQRHIKSG